MGMWWEIEVIGPLTENRSVRFHCFSSVVGEDFKVDGVSPWMSTGPAFAVCSACLALFEVFSLRSSLNISNQGFRSMCLLPFAGDDSPSKVPSTSSIRSNICCNFPKRSNNWMNRSCYMSHCLSADYFKKWRPKFWSLMLVYTKKLTNISKVEILNSSKIAPSSARLIFNELSAWPMVNSSIFLAVVLRLLDSVPQPPWISTIYLRSAVDNCFMTS